MTRLLETSQGWRSPTPVEAPAQGLPDCQFCTEEIADGHPEWEADPASVMFNGSFYCGFHGYSLLYDRPAYRFIAGTA